MLRRSIALAINAVSASPARRDEQEDEKDSLGVDVGGALGESRRQLDEIGAKSGPIARKTLRRVAQRQAEGFTLALGRKYDPNALSAKKAGKKAAQLLRVDPFRSEPWLELEMERAVREHVALVRSVAEHHLEDLEQVVTKSVRAGVRGKDLASAIVSRFGVSQRRAELVASDQVGKFYGRLDQIRQTRLGVDAYIWRTSKDERVRPEHEARDGQRFEWSDEPEDGHPGQAIRCRCYADPEMPEFEDALAEAPDRDPVHSPAEPISPAQLSRSPLAVPELGVTMERGPASKLLREHVVIVDLEQLMRSLAKDPSHFVGPGGTAEISGRVSGAHAFIDRARREGIAVHMSQVGLKDGEAFVSDGRHRLETFRQLGIKEIPVSVDRSDVKAFRERFGVRLPKMIRPVPGSRKRKRAV